MEKLECPVCGAEMRFSDGTVLACSQCETTLDVLPAELFQAVCYPPLSMGETEKFVCFPPDPRVNRPGCSLETDDYEL